jgi:outer membrane biosynthesis protein TonB
MRRSAFISAAMHVAILLWAVVAFPASKMDAVPLVAIPVDVTTPSNVTKIKAGMADAKDEGILAGKPKEKTQEVVKEKAEKELEAPPQAKDEKKPAPKEETRKDKPKKDEAKKEEPKKAAEQKKPEAKKAEADEPKPKPTPKPKQAKAKKRDFNTDRIAALLNKIPDAKDEPEPQELAEETKPVKGQSNGKEMSMGVNEIDALRARIAQCWNPPPGGLGADDIVVKIRLKLNEDGTLTGYPTVANRGSSPFFQAAADSAVRAVYQCQPYVLPPEKYAVWRDMILNFDPSQMYRAG